MDHGGKSGRLYLSHENLGWLLPSLLAALQAAGGGSAGEAGLPCAAHLLLDWRLAPDNDHAVDRAEAEAQATAVEVAFRLPAPAASALRAKPCSRVRAATC